jgi:peptidase C25-like protein/type IX secretion system substrate protein
MMKKLGVFCILFIAVICVSGGTISRTYDISAPRTVSSGEFESITFEGALLTGEAGSPALPYFAVILLLPPGEIATSVKFIGIDEKKIAGEHNIFPYQSSRPISSEGSADFLINEHIYKSNNRYPAINTGNVTTSYLAGYGIAMTSFTPVIYLPSSGQVSYYRKVKIIVETKSDSKSEIALDNLTSSETNRNRVSNFVHNAKMIEQYNCTGRRSDETYKLLIITPDQFSDDFEELRKIYLDRGIKSEVATVEDISVDGTGIDLQDKIRNHIIQEYQDNQIEYVLLGGDVEYIPHRGFYCYVQSGSGYTSYDIPADLYYSALDGNWNDDGDNQWGEQDEDDLLPEIAIARFPFSNSIELARMIHKSINYQNSPVLGELTNSLLAGENLYYDPDTWGRDYLDLVIGERSDNGYTTIGIPETNPIDSLYEHEAYWNGSHLMNEINEGKQFVHHIGHANPSYVAHLYITDITNSNFYGANGTDHNYTLFHTQGCDCGAFDSDDCILEKMVTIDNFAVSVIGNSRYGWFNEGQSEGPSAHLHREMVDAMYNDRINHLGFALVESKIQTAPWVEAPGQWEEGALRWNFYDLNILGDPVLSVWTAEPIDISVDYEEEVEVGAESTTVTVSSNGIPAEDFTCSILRDGILYASGVTDVVGSVTLVFDPVISEPGQAMLIVTGYNCLPDTNYIEFVPAASAYVVYNDHIIVDNEGNSNGIADFGETILLDLSVCNNGALEASEVIANLSTIDYYITFIDENEQYGFLSPDDTVMKYGAFGFEISPVIPNEQEILFSLSCESNGQTWLSDFAITAYAPIAEIGNMIINDSNGGNGDNELDPGELAIITINITNLGGAECNETVVGLTVDNPYLIIDPELVNIGDMLAGETVAVDFNIEVDEMIPNGSEIVFDCNVNMCQYTDQKIFESSVGIVMEDFETGDFSAFNWQMNGDQNWKVVSINPFNGNYCSKSGNIQDNESSDLFIVIDVAEDDEITFYKKISSESGSDYLRFYIDDNLKGEWSGDMGWSNESYEILSGQNTLKWSYEKDANSSAGFDCAWLDDIVLPPFMIVTNISNNEFISDFKIYPNPGTEYISLIFNLTETKAEVSIYDIHGRNIISIPTNLNSKELKINVGEVKSGLYFVEVNTGYNKIVRKLVIN